MAQTGYTPIQIYRSSTASAAPTSGNLVAGELAINTADGKLFYLDNLNAVQVIGWKLVPVTAGGTGTTTSTGTGSVVLSDSPTFTTKITTPSVTATTTDLTLSAISTGAVKFNTLGGLQAQVADIGDGTRPLQLNGGSAGGVSSAGISATVGALQLSTAGNNISFYSNGRGATQQFNISHTASAVNYVQVTGAATGSRPSITAQGSDANAGLSISAKGAGNILFFQSGSVSAGTNQTFQISTGGTANYFNVSPSNAGSAPILGLLGSDTNVSMALQTKGTGAIDLAAGSSGVNISNGGTVTAITRTSAGTSYTSAPTWSASAPTTAGGVTATGTTYLALQTIPTITSGGTGYTVGDTLTFVGGSGITTATTLTVSTVSSGVITAVTIAANGAYATPPTSPISVTGGTGTGATFTTTAWGVASTIVIGTVGSGYIEQPTVTFSGGGGSGASAYAIVGSATTFKTLSNTLSVATPAGEQLRVSDSGNSTLDYVQISGGANPFIATGGASANSSLSISSRGTGSLNFRTNGVAVTQMAVSHTASAVNYVQVTGAATGNPPRISAQGSDATIAMQYSAKGWTNHEFFSQNFANKQFQIQQTTASPINSLLVTATATGVAPYIGVQGTDTNINLALTPKGTGTVQFGTYTGTILTPTGYITITDSGGTTRRLLVG